MASAFLPEREERGVGGDAPVAVGRPVEEDDVLQRGNGVEQPLALRAPPVVGGDEELGLAVADDEVPLLGVLRLVHRHERGAERVAGVGRDGPLDAVVGDAGDGVAPLDAERREPAAEALDQRAELGVGGPHPAAVLLRSEELALPVGGGAVRENVDQGLEPGLERHGSRAAYTARAKARYTRFPVSFRYLVVTFGCQMNVHDSERMAVVLRAAGGAEVERAEDADLGRLQHLQRPREGRAEAPQRGGQARAAEARAPGAGHRRGRVRGAAGGGEAARAHAALDLVVGPDNIAELPALVLEQLAGAPPVARTEFDIGQPRFLTASPEPGRAPVTAFVTTMKGCDERCSFCIVPYTRGPERYRPAREVVDEVRASSRRARAR